MSQNENSILLERANELLEEVQSHPGKLDRNLEAAIKSGDLERVQYWVTVTEGMLSQEAFNHD